MLARDAARRLARRALRAQSTTTNARMYAVRDPRRDDDDYDGWMDDERAMWDTS